MAGQSRHCRGRVEPITLRTHNERTRECDIAAHRRATASDATRGLCRLKVMLSDQVASGAARVIHRHNKVLVSRHEFFAQPLARLPRPDIKMLALSPD